MQTDLSDGKKMGNSPVVNVTKSDLVSFDRSNYSDPEFSWKSAIGVTALGFLNSSTLG
jgi:hypothetical protein